MADGMSEAEERERLRYLELKAKAARLSETEQVVAEPEVSQLESGARGARQGVTLGFADELEGMAGVGLDWLTGLDEEQAALLGEAPVSATQNYQGLRDAVRAEEHMARDANPWTYGLSEAAAAMLVPGGPVSGGLRQVAGRAAAEGAVAGLGASEADTLGGMARDMGLGATVGGGTAAVLRGVADIGNQLSKRRVAQDLYDPTRGEGMEFMPVHLADPEGGLGNFYRGTVGRVWGAQGRLIDQQRPFVDSAEAGIQRASRAKDETAEMLKREVEDAVPEKRITEAAERQKDDIAQAAAGRTDAAVENAEEAVATGLARFRRTAIDETIPSRMPEELVEDIRGMTPREADKAIRNWYKNDGYSMVKNREFRFDDTLKKQLRSMLDNDPALKLQMGGVISEIRNMQRTLGGAPAAPTKAGQPGTGVGAVDRGPLEVIDEVLEAPEFFIDGEALMAMRNVFARRANKGSESYEGSALARVRDKFDDLILKQLDEQNPREAAQYLEELEKWSAVKRVQKSTEKARKRGEEFTPEDWMSSGRGDMLQETAEEAADDIKYAKGPGLTQAKALISDAAKAQTKSVRRQADKSRGAAKIERARRTRDTNKAASQTLNKAREKLSDLATLTQDPTGLSTLLTTSTLGGLSGAAALAAGAGVPAAMAAIPAGIMLGKGMARPGAQRMLAGQTGLQKGMQKLGADERSRMLAKLMRQGLSREAALAAVGD
jgi:hypothetical protein